jgi:hypothetical protein
VHSQVAETPADQPIAQPGDLVDDYRAQRQRNADSAEALRRELDAAYDRIELMREQREGAMRAVITTAILSGGIVALLLVLFYRNKLKSARELAELNARLDKQWKDLCKTNEELSRVNKEMADALERLAKR